MLNLRIAIVGGEQSSAEVTAIRTVRAMVI